MEKVNSNPLQVVILGTSGVGKTAIARKFLDESFNLEELKPTERLQDKFVTKIN